MEGVSTQNADVETFGPCGMMGVMAMLRQLTQTKLTGLKTTLRSVLSHRRRVQSARLLAVLWYFSKCSRIASSANFFAASNVCVVVLGMAMSTPHSSQRAGDHFPLGTGHVLGYFCLVRGHIKPPRGGAGFWLLLGASAGTSVARATWYDHDAQPSCWNQRYRSLAPCVRFLEGSMSAIEIYDNCSLR